MSLGALVHNIDLPLFQGKKIIGLKRDLVDVYKLMLNFITLYTRMCSLCKLIICDAYILLLKVITLVSLSLLIVNIAFIRKTKHVKVSITQHPCYCILLSIFKVLIRLLIFFFLLNAAANFLKHISLITYELYDCMLIKRKKKFTRACDCFSHTAAHITVVDI